ncbi:hypothetical protein, partial [Limosilactobacillus fermentum]|uniref:hypothetical protein n=1 Tax=Limosilactobacillus fermentum TaxID=1613 RepID=UPI0022EBA97F
SLTTTQIPESKRCDLMTDYIKNILQIKDPNLHFTDVVFENNDGWETQVFIGGYVRIIGVNSK